MAAVTAGLKTPLLTPATGAGKAPEWRGPVTFETVKAFVASSNFQVMRYEPTKFEGHATVGADGRTVIEMRPSEYRLDFDINIDGFKLTRHIPHSPTLLRAAMLVCAYVFDLLRISPSERALLAEAIRIGGLSTDLKIETEIQTPRIMAGASLSFLANEELERKLGLPASFAYTPDSDGLGMTRRAIAPGFPCAREAAPCGNESMYLYGTYLKEVPSEERLFLSVHRGGCFGPCTVKDNFDAVSIVSEKDLRAIDRLLKAKIAQLEEAKAAASLHPPATAPVLAGSEPASVATSTASHSGSDSEALSEDPLSRSA